MATKLNMWFLFRVQSQQKPFLLLPNADRVTVPPNQAFWQLVLEPVTRHRQQGNVLGLKPYLFVQLPIHGLFGAFTVIYSPLGKLPGMLAIASGPQYLAFAIADHYAYIGTKSVAIYHAITRLKS